MFEILKLHEYDGKVECLSWFFLLLHKRFNSCKNLSSSSSLNGKSLNLLSKLIASGVITFTEINWLLHVTFLENFLTFSDALSTFVSLVNWLFSSWLVMMILILVLFMGYCLLIFLLIVVSYMDLGDHCLQSENVAASI